MEDLERKIPIELTLTLNNFNEMLFEMRNEIIMDAFSNNVIINSSNQLEITISYRLKNTNFFFDIYYQTDSELINWKYNPYTKTSTKPTSTSRDHTSNTFVFSRLMDNLISWKQLIENFKNIENPIKFFMLDDFIKFYSDEILEHIPSLDNENKFPLSSDKQVQALKLIELQIEFINNEINSIEDQTSEKYNDLVYSKRLIERIKEDLPRITIAQLKRNWSISLAGIKKWCGDTFIQLINMDKETKYDLSRSLGSFIGGLFGLPKLEN